MYKQKLGFIALTLLLACAHATAGDPAPAAKDAHAAPAKESPKEAAPAKDAHAAAPKDAHAAEPKEAAKGAAKDAKEVKEASKDAAPAKDTHSADSHDAAASKDEPKPVARKAKRKKPKTEAKAQAKGHGDAKASADHHADTAPVVPASIEPTIRVRPRDRTAAASAVVAEQSAGAHDAHGDSHAAAPASAKQDAHGARSDAHQADTHAAPVAATKQDTHGAKADDAHHADAASPVPSNMEPTPRQRVKSPVAATAATSAPAHADTTAHDDHHAADAHGKSAHAAPDAKHAAKDSGGHDAHHDAKHDAKSQDAHAASTHAGDECNLPLKAEIAALFDRWNTSLRTGDPKKVVANYAPDSVLLPTVSNRARFTIAEKEDYFMHFLQRRPQGYIDDRMIDVDCNSATDAGLYTFRFADGSSVKARYSFSYKKINGQWLITSHHSSGMPEKPAAPSAAHAEVHAAPKAGDSGSSTKGWVRFP
jgi:uncharacterized protein (TIGR02246 family)